METERPVVLLQHFRGQPRPTGTPHWSTSWPLPGGRSPSTTRVSAGPRAASPHTMAETAAGAELLRSSTHWTSTRSISSGSRIGSFVAPGNHTLTRPSVVNRVVLASSAPKGAPDMHGWAANVIEAVGTPQTTPEEYLSVFFAPRRQARELASQRSAGSTNGPKRLRHAHQLGVPGRPVRRRV